MKKYKVEFTQTETFIVDVLANTEAEAIEKAEVQFATGDYQELGDCTVNAGTVYNVTNTDDPFDAVLNNDETMLELTGQTDAEYTGSQREKDDEAFDLANNK